MPGESSTFKRATAEFVANFAGVTLSLLADDWRDSRGEAEDRRDAYEQLHRDRATVARDASAWLLNNWDRSNPPRDSVEAALAPFALPLIFEFRSPGFAGLKDANRVPLVDDLHLRAPTSGQPPSLFEYRGSNAPVTTVYATVSYRFINAQC